MTTEPYLKTFQLDSTMDLEINDLQKIPMITGGNKVAQDTKILFMTIIGDNIFHLDMGFDFDAATFLYSDNVLIDEITRTMEQYRFLKSIEKIDILEKNSITRTVEARVTVKMYTEEELTISVVIS